MLPSIQNVTFQVELPSTKKKVTMRQMKVKEEKILLTAKESNEPLEILQAIKQVVRNCLIDDADISLFDLEYLFLQLRAQSVSDIAEVSYIDNDEVADWWETYNKEHEDEGERTEEAYQELRAKAQKACTRTFKIDLKKVKVKMPKEMKSRIAIDDKRGIILKYPSGDLYGDRDLLEGNNALDKMIAQSIEGIYDGDKWTPPTEEDMQNISSWVDNLPIKTHNEILEFFENQPSLFYEIKYKNKLGQERKIPLTTLNDFFTFV